MTMPAPAPTPEDQSQPPRRPDRGLRFIALLKIGKALLITGLAFGFFHAINRDLGDSVRDLTIRLRIDPENHIIRILLEKLGTIPTRNFHRFGIISLIYAGELYLEGLGLWFNQAWAEYLLIFATGVWIPEEGYYCIQHFGWGRFSLLLLNLALLIYVILALIRKKRAH